MYANINEYDLALPHLNLADGLKTNPLVSKMALAYVYLKMSRFSSAGTNLAESYTTWGDKATNLFPIKVNLKKSLFDINLAQIEFQNLLEHKERLTLLLETFYFEQFLCSMTLSSLSLPLKKGFSTKFSLFLGGKTFVHE